MGRVPPARHAPPPEGAGSQVFYTKFFVCGFKTFDISINLVVKGFRKLINLVWSKVFSRNLRKLINYVRERKEIFPEILESWSILVVNHKSWLILVVKPKKMFLKSHKRWSILVVKPKEMFLKSPKVDQFWSWNQKDYFSKHKKLINFGRETKGNITQITKSWSNLVVKPKEMFVKSQKVENFWSWNQRKLFQFHN